MTFAQLLGHSIDDLEKMSVEELHKYLDPYLKVTRPELVDKTANKTFRTRSESITRKKQLSEDQKVLNGQKQLIEQILASKGIKLKL